MKRAIQIFILIYAGAIIPAHAQIPRCNFITIPVLPTVCKGNCVSLNGPSSNLCAGGPTAYASYFWMPGGNTTPSIVVCPTVSTTYTLIVCCNINSVVSCCDTILFPVQVNPAPVVAISGPSTICAGQFATFCATGGGVAYAWNTGVTSACISVNPSVTTMYCVTTIDANGCSATACATLTVLPCSTGISENNILNSISILPNPSSGVFAIQADNKQMWTGRIEIYNVIGEKVYTTSVFPHKSSSEIDISSQPSGVYFLKIINQDGNSAIRKIIKE